MISYFSFSIITNFSKDDGGGSESIFFKMTHNLLIKARSTILGLFIEV